MNIIDKILDGLILSIVFISFIATLGLVILTVWQVWNGGNGYGTPITAFMAFALGVLASWYYLYMQKLKNITNTPPGVEGV
jgi:hypothetical protein